MITQATLNALEASFGPTTAGRTLARPQPVQSPVDSNTFSQYARIRSLIPTLSEMPHALLEVKNGLSRIDLRWKPSDHEHSILEHLCHLRNVETQRHGAHICRLLAEDQPWQMAVYSDALAAAGSYVEQHALGVINDFFQARQVNIRRINTLSPEHLSRAGRLLRAGPVHMTDVIQAMIKHDQKHLEAIRSMRTMLLTL